MISILHTYCRDWRVTQPNGKVERVRNREDAIKAAYATAHRLDVRGKAVEIQILKRGVMMPL